MKSYRKELWFNVPGRRASSNITPQVEDRLRESCIEKGLCLVNATITDHAGEEAQADGLPFDEIFGSLLRGEVIEDYPDNWPYPTCLV